MQMPALSSQLAGAEHRHEAQQQTGLGIIGKRSTEVGAQRPLGARNPDRFTSGGIIERKRDVTHRLSCGS